MYGWNTTKFVARERDEPYGVELLARKGMVELFALSFDVRLASGGNASEEITKSVHANFNVCLS